MNQVTHQPNTAGREKSVVTGLIAVAIGAVWAVIFTLIISILAMLASGETMVPSLGVACAAGALSAACYILIPPMQRKVWAFAVTAVIYVIAFVALSLAHPF